MNIDYAKVGYITVKGNLVTRSPYMGNHRPNALLEDLAYRRARAQYVCVTQDDKPIELNSEICPDHIAVCVAALEKNGVTEPGKRAPRGKKAAEAE